MIGAMVSMPEVVGVALEVIAGKYGNDAERVVKLTAAGYDYRTVQLCVNDLLILFEKYD